MGMGHTPSTIFGAQPSKGDIIRELVDVRKDNEDLRSRVTDWEGRLEEERSKWQADSDAQIERLLAESKAQMEDMMRR